MAIAFGGISTLGTTQNVTSIVVTGTNTIGIVQVKGDVNSDDITAVTWGGVSMTKIAAVTIPVNDRVLSTWWVANPSSGGTISFTGGSFWQSYNFYYTGAAQTGQPDSFNSGTSTAATTLAVATTVVASNCWAIFTGGNSSGNRTTTTSAGTVRQGSDDFFTIDSNATVATGSYSVTATENIVATGLGGIAFSIAPAAAVVASPIVHSLSLLGVGQ